MMDAHNRVRTLTEALPYLQTFRDRVVVIKYGGGVMNDATLTGDFERDVVLLENVGIHPVVVHGGGPMITHRLKESGLDSHFVEGIRITTDEAMEQVGKALREVNVGICEGIRRHGGRAAGMTDGNSLRVERMPPLGPDRISPQRVGVIKEVSHEMAELSVRQGVIPVVAPIGCDDNGLIYNINADRVAEAVAVSLKAEKLILMTNTSGVLDAEERLIVRMTRVEMTALIEQGIIRGGMLPKVQCAVDAVRDGVKAAHIIDGRVDHAVLLELLTDEGVGTLVTRPDRESGNT